MKRITTKPTPAMQKVLTLMRNGWQLASSGTMDGRSWLQQGGAGRGGEWKDVNANTFHGLYRRGFIQIDKQGFPTTTWKLVEETTP